MYTYKLTIAYDGTGYGGWQIQPNKITIQETIQTFLEKIVTTPAHLTGSGRTDAGVHALGQVAHIKLGTKIDPERLLFSLNKLLPKEIRILSIEEVINDFHARYSAKQKIYRYQLTTNPYLHPLERFYWLKISYPIDMQKLTDATHPFIGTKNFLSFANEADRGAAKHNPIKTIEQIALIEKTPGAFYLELKGDGFLYKMVRNIVGTLLAVARGKIPLTAVEEILAKQDRRAAPQTAPAHPLFLLSVLY